jgi:hypothetical protein
MGVATLKWSSVLACFSFGFSFHHRRNAFVSLYTVPVSRTAATFHRFGWRLMPPTLVLLPKQLKIRLLPRWLPCFVPQWR